MLDLDRAAYPLAGAILAELGGKMPFLLRAAENGHGAPLAERLPELENIAMRLSQISEDRETWIPGAVKAYILLSLEMIKLQAQLEKTGRYLLSTEREAYDRVYSRGDVIGFYYLAGLLLSQALWPTHFGLGRAFRNEFLPLVMQGAKVLEIGVGTGYQLRSLLRAVPSALYEGVDISTYSIEFARRFAFGNDSADKRAKFSLQNAAEGLRWGDETFDAVICGEVLEHVERPDRLLNEIRRVLRRGKPFFMTTAIFAANIDHIYLFENARQIRELIDECGWTLSNEWIFPIYDVDPESSKQPMTYGSILLRAN